MSAGSGTDGGPGTTSAPSARSPAFPVGKPPLGRRTCKRCSLRSTSTSRPRLRLPARTSLTCDPPDHHPRSTSAGAPVNAAPPPTSPPRGQRSSHAARLGPWPLPLPTGRHTTPCYRQGRSTSSILITPHNLLHETHERPRAHRTDRAILMGPVTAMGIDRGLPRGSSPQHGQRWLVPLIRTAGMRMVSDRFDVRGGLLSTDWSGGQKRSKGEADGDEPPVGSDLCPPLRRPSGRFWTT